MRRSLTLLGLVVVALAVSVTPHMAAPAKPWDARRQVRDKAAELQRQSEVARRAAAAARRRILLPPERPSTPTPTPAPLATQSPSGSVGITVTVQPGAPAAFDFALETNYPNPMIGSTLIYYSIARPTHVSLKIYSIVGQEVATLVNDHRDPGRFSVRWDRLDNRGRRVAPGIYLYSLDAGSYVRTRRIVVQ
jgi:hypothetical protein